MKAKFKVTVEVTYTDEGDGMFNAEVSAEGDGMFPSAEWFVDFSRQARPVIADAVERQGETDDE